MIKGSDCRSDGRLFGSRGELSAFDVIMRLRSAVPHKNPHKTHLSSLYIADKTACKTM